MEKGNGKGRESMGTPAVDEPNECPGMDRLHPAWRAMIRYCREMGHGELESVRIQDGLPVSAEVVTKKIRWC